MLNIKVPQDIIRYLFSDETRYPKNKIIQAAKYNIVADTFDEGIPKIIILYGKLAKNYLNELTKTQIVFR